MKQVFYLIAIAFLFTNCNDDLELVNENPQVNVSVEQEVIEGEVLFSDLVLNEKNEPLSGVVVSVYASNNRYTDVTDDKGAYDIRVPLAELPSTGFISVSVNAPDFKPHNLTYQAPLEADNVYGSESGTLRLSPCPTCLEIDVKSSELIHLGDDNYSGSVNSQFQKATDGIEIEFDLEGSTDYSSLNVSYQIKGIQPDRFEMKSSIEFSSDGELVREQLIEMNAPEDGSFDTFMYEVDNAQPITSIKFITRNHGQPGSDYDDWEFTCLYIEGVK